MNIILISSLILIPITIYLTYLHKTRFNKIIVVQDFFIKHINGITSIEIIDYAEEKYIYYYPEQHLKITKDVMLNIEGYGKYIPELNISYIITKLTYNN
ncbi:hypothetical protein Hokovirus_3_67 [Hokovirus HKV1]|uniref:Uncharacterized protein n=1 Tax=Hokovirus HKV1 TaxID=1977638 RepID=A0A1V0SGM1_9VIRU|nr:hypothetical protein Hokovirus_3_67 [Hokovirus HKV1]